MDKEIDYMAVFQQQFPSEEACAAFLYKAKWPSGFRCPRCEYRQFYTIAARAQQLYQCRQCGHQTSLRAGTMMEGSRTSLWKWLMAIWLVSRPEGKVHAVRLKALIGVTYKTAWLMLHKIRQAIGKADAQQLLAGNIQAGLTHCFSPYSYGLEQHPQAHPAIIGVQVDEQEQAAYMKIKYVPANHMRRSLLDPKGSAAFIQEHTCYEGEKAIHIAGQKHLTQRIPLLKQLMIETRRWLNDTFHGLGAKYLQAYLDEFCYRFNRRNAPNCTVEHLTGLCMRTA